MRDRVRESISEPQVEITPGGLRPPLCDAHADTLQRIADAPEEFSRGSGYLHIDVPKLDESGLGLLCAATWVSIEEYKRFGAARTLKLFNTATQLAEAYPTRFRVLKRVADVPSFAGKGRTSLFPTLEGAYQLEAFPDDLAQVREMGLQAVTLLHSTANSFGDSATDTPLHGGLSLTGNTLVSKLNQAKIAIDVSHASDQCVRDILNNSRQPVYASHSCCFALSPHPRNLNDDILKEIAGSGGIICICAHSPYLAGTSERATIETLVDHIDHAVSIVGAEAVGLGSDFDGGIAPPTGFENISKLPFLASALRSRGYFTDTIDAILGGNLLAYFGRVQT